MDNPEELEFAGNILFSSTVFQIGDVSFVRLKEVTLILISGLFPILASTAAVSTATRASSSERLPVGFTVLSENGG